MSLYLQHVPKLWKQAIIIPVPKSNSPKVLNDLRPVALTSLVMKSFEKLVKMEIVRQTEQALDPMQFAYRAHRGVEDATITLLHLEGRKTHARLLFVDFSSAFNTIQPHILAKRLIEHFSLSKNLVGWILVFSDKQNTEGESKWHFVKFTVYINWLTTGLCSFTLILYFVH